MLAISLIGAALVICGVVAIARAAINRGRMSDPHQGGDDSPDVTLEPRRQGMGFLGAKANLAGLLMLAAGGLLLLAPMFFGPAAP